MVTHSHSDPVLHEYNVGDIPFDRVQSVRDLGVRFNSKLKFKDICNSEWKVSALSNVSLAF